MSKRTTAAVLAIAVVVLTAAIAAAAEGGEGTRNHAVLGPHKIVGTWRATVNRGPALPPVKSLHIFTLGGSIIESGSDSPYRTPAHGVWEYVGDNTYATTQVFHRFSSTGEYLGTHEINASRRLSPDGESYVGVAVGILRDPAGNVIATPPPATVTATRMQVERIPNQP